MTQRVSLSNFVWENKTSLYEEEKQAAVSYTVLTHNINDNLVFDMYSKSIKQNYFSDC